MLGQRHRRWPSMKTTVRGCVVFAGLPDTRVSDGAPLSWRQVTLHFLLRIAQCSTLISYHLIYMLYLFIYFRDIHIFSY